MQQLLGPYIFEVAQWKRQTLVPSILKIGSIFGKSYYAEELPGAFQQDVARLHSRTVYSLS